MSKIITDFIVLLFMVYFLLLAKGIFTADRGKEYFERNKKWLPIVAYILIAAYIVKLIMDIKNSA